MMKRSARSRCRASLVMTRMTMVIFVVSAYSTASSGGELQGYSGLNHFVPVGTRNALYKSHAIRSRVVSELGDLEDMGRWRGIGVLGECGISIGNTISDNNAPGNMGDKENIVIIDGDVVNVGKCD